jgi:uncharacterized protein YbbC (DUF1343 family)/CubicO group peptidase (beta-lactamase class C family)
MRIPAILCSAFVLNVLAFAGPAGLTGALARAIEHGTTPGAVYWFEQDGRAQHWAQGNRALVPAVQAMTEDTVFDIASLSKVVATLPAVMLLVERGRLRLEAPVRDYLPEFGNGEITLKQLLTHTSGLPPGLPKVNGTHTWRGYGEGLRRALECRPEPGPGRGFRYSDVNFILLGEIVQRVSGRSLKAFVEGEIFAPLGMTDSGYLPEGARLARVAPTERDESGQMLRGVVHDPTARHMGGVAGHAGVFSTAADLARYARFSLNGGPLLKPETLRLMQSVQTPATVRDRRGLGWDLDSVFSSPRGSLYGLGSFGHSGYTGTALWIDPGTRSFYVLLTTRLHPDGKGQTRDLYREIGTLSAQAAGLSVRPETALLARAEQELPTVLNGIDVLKRQHFAALKGLRAGLISNATGLDSERNPTIDLLRAAPGVRLVRLFSPEHGIRGELDQENIPDGIDARSGLPVISLYRDGQRAPTPGQLADLDALVFDIQDIGCRFYTYIATLKAGLEAAAKAGKPFIVLDRVNPIRGDRVEGPAAPAALSFTACHPIALRHGMTAGELARMFNAELALKADLRIIEVQGWERGLWYDGTGLPWRDPSPNMRTLTAAALYPGIGLLERALSVGRGTGTPFELLGAPYINDRVLAFELNQQGLPGVSFLPERFTPSASVFQGQECGGVRILVTDRDALRPVELGVAIARTLFRLHGPAFELDKVDSLLKDPATLVRIRAGESLKAIVQGWEGSRGEFLRRREGFLIYR